MSKRIPVNITLTPEAINRLTKLAQHQLRSRSHTIESLITEAWIALDKETRAQHKARKQPQY